MHLNVQKKHYVATLVLGGSLIGILMPTAVAHADTSTGPALSVDVAANRHTISPDIYGVNAGVDAATAKEMGATVFRWGGDATTNYNWQVDSSNSGRDWFYTGGGTANPRPGGQVDDMINEATSVSAKSVVTIPIIGWVNKTNTPNASYPSGAYPSTVTLTDSNGNQVTGPYFAPLDGLTGSTLGTNIPAGYDPYLTLPDGEYAGSGMTWANGDALATDDWSDYTSVLDTDVQRNYLKVDPQWMKGWIQHIVAQHGNSAKSGVIYQMDNEPFSWSNIHYDVHPNNTTYDEVLQDTLAYASMIKKTDPTAQILGPSPWGAPAYFGGDYSDYSNPESDYPHGMYFIPWYLQQMHQASQKSGVRLLNYLDVHYYPPTGNNNADDPTTDALRLRSTRALWDPTYTTEDWMGQWFTPAQQLDLIPRLQNWVNQYYPGTKISITEYNWGDLGNINGALAQADVLGIFGREGVSLATLWGPPTSMEPGAFAFKIYRNYDGQGSTFGNISVQSTSADQSQLAIYGAERTDTDSQGKGPHGQSQDALTMMVINKTGNDLTSAVNIQNFSPDKAATAQVYNYSSADLNNIVHEPDATITEDSGTSEEGFPNESVTETFPANSITLLVLPGHMQPNAHTTPGDGKPGHGNQNGGNVPSPGKPTDATPPVGVLQRYSKGHPGLH